MLTGLPKTVIISSEEIRRALDEPVTQIIDAMKSTLDKTPPELAADIMDRGIVLAGGGALLQGLDERAAARDADARPPRREPAHVRRRRLGPQPRGVRRHPPHEPQPRRAAQRATCVRRSASAESPVTERSLKGVRFAAAIHPNDPESRATLARHVPAAQRAIGGAGPDSPAYPHDHSSRNFGSLRRRLVVGILVLASLVLISLSFRSDDTWPGERRPVGGATALRPFAVGLRARRAAVP